MPHNPGIEYDLWTKWNQPRMDANEAGLASEGFGITRPIDNIPPEWIPEGETLPQGWDDWGPFYTGQYGQLRGLDASTVEMCNEIDATCGIDGVPPPLLGRLGALRDAGARGRLDASTSSSRTAARCSTTSTRSTGAAPRTHRVRS